MGRKDHAEELTIGLITPGWPSTEHASGIVSYTENVRAGLLGLGASVHVLSLVPCQSDEPGVLSVRSETPSVLERGIEKLLRQVDTRLPMARALLAGIRHLHRSRGLDLVEMEESHGLAANIAKQSPVPVVVRLHGPWFITGRANGECEDDSFRERVRLEGMGISQAAAVTAPSRDVLDRVRAYYGIALPDAAVIPNPIATAPSTSRWLLQTCNPRKFVFIGRMDRLKGADLVIMAFALVVRRHPEAKLVLAGPDRGIVDDSGQRRSVTELLEAYVPGGLARGQVEWVGQRSPKELLKLRQDGLATIIASRYETFGLTAVEAMASGCPTIIAETGGLSEIARHGQNSLTFQVGDVNDLASKMLFALSNPQFAAELGCQAAQDVGERFHPAPMAAQTIEFYEQVLHRWKPTTKQKRRKN